ncbi:MAG: hypothetical protein KBC30_11000 [Planctomycetes bacterium]|nr:hypothetical protein [Planctomycetota bacterium]HON44212.1 hypothetical protein [Planctomycetota bacterium]HPY75570.1 hypothetical protein [Planctomycetota bacterium]HQB01164.1 hypothetical protein [Planctomycetota bacterium]HRU52052.1 hypothetical protein [Planctomycetota bacterium]
MFYSMKCHICGSSVKKDTINCPVCGNRINDAKDIKDINNNDDLADMYDLVCDSRPNDFSDASNNPDYYDPFFKYDYDKRDRQKEAPVTFKTWIIAFFLGLTVFGGVVAGMIEMLKGNTTKSLIYITSFFWSWIVLGFMIYLFMFITILLHG